MPPSIYTSTRFLIAQKTMADPEQQALFDRPIVKVEDLHFSFSGRPLYQGLNLVVPRGKVTVVMGPSGCGKSTLLNFIGGRLHPSRSRDGQGQVWFEDMLVPAKNSDALFTMRRKMGMLFQSSALLTDLSVFENIAFPLREQTDLPEALIRIMVLMKLEMVGLRGARDLMPSELSGGMARRVALARAIVLDPDMVMYDEPFVGLDPISMGVILKLIRELNDALGMTSIVVTHDVKEGCSIADYVYLLGEGKVIGHGTPDAMRNSEQPEVRQFMQGLPDGPVRYHYPADDYLADIGGRN